MEDELEKLIDQSDSLGIVAEAVGRKMRAEEDLKEGNVAGEFRRDLVKAFARELGDYAIKDALMYLAKVRTGSALKTEERQMQSAFGRISKIVKDVRGEGFLTEEEYEGVKRAVEDAVVFLLEKGDEKWVESFRISFEKDTFERRLSEREKEMMRLKAPYTAKREALKDKLKKSKDLKNQREQDILEYADAVTHEQIYEANRQYEGNTNPNEEEKRIGMFTHLVVSWKALQELSEYDTSYISQEEVKMVINKGLEITRNFYSESPDFLSAFERAFVGVFGE